MTYYMPTPEGKSFFNARMFRVRAVSKQNAVHGKTGKDRSKPQGLVTGRYMWHTRQKTPDSITRQHTMPCCIYMLANPSIRSCLRECRPPPSDASVLSEVEANRLQMQPRAT
ncbi:unnamed protein product [Ectocarpus sp. 12 AP-2014]